MDALTKQSIQRLCERLGAFRLGGPIPALMAEYPVGTPEEDRPPLGGFADTLVSNVLRELPDGSRFVRSVWLAADCELVKEFRIFCEQAGGLVMPILHSAGLQVGRHAPNLQARWQWAVFELAEMQLVGTSLRLVGEDVFRCDGPSRTVGERAIRNEKHRAKQGLFASLIAAAGNTRYWQLADAVEASLAALDIAANWQEPAAVGLETATPIDSRRKVDVVVPLKKQKYKLNPKEQLVILYERDPKVATLASPMLPGIAKKAFGKSYCAKAYANTALYKRWRALLKEHNRYNAKGWLDVDALEEGLEIYTGKPGRSDKRGTTDPKHEAAVTAFFREPANVTVQAKAR